MRFDTDRAEVELRFGQKNTRCRSSGAFGGFELCVGVCEPSGCLKHPASPERQEDGNIINKMVFEKIC